MLVNGHIHEEMSSFLLSTEQQAIIDEVKKGSNVATNAVAGSGKTTTVVHLAKQIEKQILQLTYNSALKFEVRNKVIMEGVNNLEVHSYHSFAVGNYDRTAHEDTALSKVVYGNKVPTRAFCYDIIVIDEAQDMTMLLFHFIKKIVHDNHKPVQLVIMGDVHQAIYEFKGSDYRFLSECDTVFGRQFVHLPLSRSYRLTDTISAFVNQVMLGKGMIHTEKPGTPVKYYIGNTFIEVPLVKMVQMYLSNGYTCEDIFILSPSVRSSTSANSNPLTKLENALVEAGIPCFVSSDAQNKLNEEVLKGKVVFSTFHQSKGRERPIVFVYGFDEAWYTYYGKGKDTTICPNELYVATTRASREMILVHCHSERQPSKPLPFLRSSVHEMRECNYIDVMGYMAFRKEDSACNGPQEVSPCSVTELTKYIKEDALSTLRNMMDLLFKPYSAKKSMVSIPSFVKTEYGLVEPVSDLNGIAIQLMWQQTHQNTSDIKRHILHDNSPQRIIRKALDDLPSEIHTPAEYLYLANLSCAHDTQYIARLAQIKEYTWLTQEMVEDCHEVIDRHLLHKPYQFEYTLSCDVDEKDTGSYKYPGPYYETDRFRIPITGRVDVINDSEIWELKCVDMLTIEHYLQVIIYGWIWKTFMQETHGSRRMYLLNMRSNEGYELDTSSYLIDEVMRILIHNKYHNTGQRPLSVWIEQCESYTPVKATSTVPHLHPKKLKTGSTSIQTTLTKWLGTSLTT